ncbi:TNP1, partial [Trifolium pratense]
GLVRITKVHYSFGTVRINLLHKHYNDYTMLLYMKQLCTRLGKSNMYGFIDPNFIQPQNDRVGSQSYVTEKLVESEKDCFFVPYLNNCHWQLLIIEPKAHNVIFLCSMGLKPDKNIVLIVDSAINGYNRLKGSRKQRKPTWNTTLTCQRQSFNYESGYYVMIHMMNIVSAGIVNSWNRVFGDATPFHEDEVSNVQERCANAILEVI